MWCLLTKPRWSQSKREDVHTTSPTVTSHVRFSRNDSMSLSSLTRFSIDDDIDWAILTFHKMTMKCPLHDKLLQLNCCLLELTNTNNTAAGTRTITHCSSFSYRAINPCGVLRHETCDLRILTIRSLLRDNSEFAGAWGCATTTSHSHWWRHNHAQWD